MSIDPYYLTNPLNLKKPVPIYAKEFPELDITIKGYTWTIRLHWHLYASIANIDSIESIYKNMFRYPGLNVKTYHQLRDWFPKAEDAAHTAWSDASKACVFGWRDIENMRASKKEIRAAKSTNKELKENVKRAKAFFERTVKLRIRFFEILEKVYPDGQLPDYTD